MKKSLAVIYMIILLVIILPFMTTEAQTTVTLKSYYGEDSYQQGYNFSSGVVQTVMSSDVNSVESSDIYLGDSYFPVSTTDYHDAIPVINYGATRLNDITQVPAKNDGRFATQAFVKGNTYGLFTQGGDFVVLQIQSTDDTGDFREWGESITFSWQYVKQAQPEGVLSLSLSSPGKTDYSLGENVQLEGYLLLDGAPIHPRVADDLYVSLSVKDKSGKWIFGVSLPPDNTGRYWVDLEYGLVIPTGYQGTLTVTASAKFRESEAEKTLNIEYGSKALDKPLKLELFGPDEPIEIGGYHDINIGGKVTSQGEDVNGALVTMKVAGQTFQTTTGTHTSGSFAWSWLNDTFPAGNYIVDITVAKDGYQTVTGKIPFTVIGEGYNHLVKMDPIPATLEPGLNVSFPGTYTLGGKPHEGWLEINITYPNGRTITYTPTSRNDGRFTLTLPSMQETGIYTLKAYRFGTSTLISDTYTWRVGEAEPEPEPEPVDPPQAYIEYEIVDVIYPKETVAEQTITISGKVIGRQGEEVVPQEDWEILIDFKGPEFGRYDESIKTTTGIDGTFNIKFAPSFNQTDTISIGASRFTVDYLDRSQNTHWIGPIKITNPLDPLLTIDQTEYDRGSVLQGVFKLRPAARFHGWNDDLKIFYRVVGPLGGTEINYIFASADPVHQDLLRNEDEFHVFHWKIPDNAVAGNYRITAHVTGRNLDPTEVSEEFYVSDLERTTVTAYLEPSADGWSSADLVGQYSDSRGEPISGGNLRVHFFTVFGGAGKDSYREFDMNGTIEQDGTFSLNLEQFDFFAAQDQENPWDPGLWEATVYAEKEGYATTATVIEVKTPTVNPKIEIISINPETNHFDKIAEGGINYKNLVDMNITVKVRYNNIFDGAKLTVGSRGHWGLYEPEPNPDDLYYFHLDIEGAKLPPKYKYYDWTWVKYLNYPHGGYLFPDLSTQVAAKTGLGQESEFTVRGKINLHFYDVYDVQNSSFPYDPSHYPVILVYAALGEKNTATTYHFTPPVTAPVKIEVLTETNDTTGLRYKGVAADGASNLGISIKVHGATRGGSFKLTSDPKLGELTGKALASNGEITLDQGTASLTYIPPDYLTHSDLTEYSSYGDNTSWFAGNRWYAVVPINLSYTAQDGSRHDETFEVKVYRPPVMLVHGFIGDNTTWQGLSKLLRNRKYDTHLGTYYADNHSIQAQSRLLSQNIKTKKKNSYLSNDIKLSKVDIVAHSMGGLISRYYIGGFFPGADREANQKYFYENDVRKLIMVGTPNHGASWLDVQLGKFESWWVDKHEIAAEQLYSESPFIVKLNQQENTGMHLHNDVEYGNIYSYSDLAGFFEGDGVVRATSAMLNGVKSYELDTHIHSPEVSWVLANPPSITESSFVNAKIMEWLTTKIERTPLRDQQIWLDSAEGDVWVKFYWIPKPIKVPTGALKNLQISPGDTIITGPESKARIALVINNSSRYGSYHREWGEIYLAENTEIALGHLSPTLSEVKLIKGSGRLYNHGIEHNKHFMVFMEAENGQWQTVRGLQTDFVVQAGSEPLIHSIEGEVLIRTSAANGEETSALIDSGESLTAGLGGELTSTNLPEQLWWEDSFYKDSLLTKIKTHVHILIFQGTFLVELYRSGNLQRMPLEYLTGYGLVITIVLLIVLTMLIVIITLISRKKKLLLLIPILAGLIIAGWIVFNYSVHNEMALTDDVQSAGTELSFSLEEEWIIPLQIASQPEDYLQTPGLSKEDGVRLNLIVDGDTRRPNNNPLFFNVLFELILDNAGSSSYTQEKLVIIDQKGYSVYGIDPETSSPQSGADLIMLWEEAQTGEPEQPGGPLKVPVDFVLDTGNPLFNTGSYSVRIIVDPDQAYGESLIRETEGWFNYHTWSTLFLPPEDESKGFIYLLHGEIDSAGEIRLDSVSLEEGSPVKADAGDYEIQIRSSAGDVLYATYLQGIEQGNSFILSLPYRPGTASIMAIKDNQVVAVLNRSGNEPIVNFTMEPLINEEAGTVEVGWAASDTDEDTLTYNLYYRHKLEQSWMLLDSGLKGSNSSINLDELPGNQCQLKLTASDGFNMTEALTEIFQTPPRGPSVNITLKEEHYREDEPVLLRGSAIDLQEGRIPVENLVWHSDLDGRLGYGPFLLASLSGGKHQISLAATDFSGNTTVDTSTITIGEPLTGMGSGLQGLWFLGGLLLFIIVLVVVLILIIISIRKRSRKNPQPDQE